MSPGPCSSTILGIQPAGQSTDAFPQPTRCAAEVWSDTPENFSTQRHRESVAAEELEAWQPILLERNRPRLRRIRSRTSGPNRRVPKTGQDDAPGVGPFDARREPTAPAIQGRRPGGLAPYDTSQATTLYPEPVGAPLTAPQFGPDPVDEGSERTF